MSEILTWVAYKPHDYFPIYFRHDCDRTITTNRSMVEIVEEMTAARYELLTLDEFRKRQAEQE